MSAPLVVPQGNDRSWTRSFYRAINKIFRRMWWEQKIDEQVLNAWEDLLVKGHGYLRINF